MAYSLVGILAIFIHLIINFDVFLGVKGKKVFRGQKVYAFFLLAVIAYHITDAIWGFLYEAKLATAVYADTMVYFLAMAASILLWGAFVRQYLGAKDRINKAIVATSLSIFGLQTVLIIINFFYPVLFSVSPDCVYKAEAGRYAMLAFQILVYGVLAVYALVSSWKSRHSARRRYFIVGVFGVFMAIAITLQALFPLLPMYSIGYLYGICGLHTFVIRNELVKHQHELAQSQQRVLTDPLTGVYSKHAYVDVEERIEKQIGNGTMKEFAIIIFDVNDLKLTNDSFGHDRGDKLICESTELIAEYYKGACIYRVGGDEFAVILEGEGYANKDVVLAAFNERMDANIKNGGPLVAAGMSVFDPERDTTILQVFTRADRDMYARKSRIKDEQAKE